MAVQRITATMYAMANRALRMLPEDWLRRIGFKMLRAGSKEFTAYSELFIPPYDRWVEWLSGLGDGAHLLYGLTRALKPDVVVEIGSARGRSTCTLALACRQNGRGRVYAIDPHQPNDWTELGTDGRNESFLRRQLRRYGLTACCDVIQTTSEEAARSWCRPIDLLFIDADHSFDGVRRDFELFLPWLTPNGLVVFHDSSWEHYRNHSCYREDMGVPRYLDRLQAAGCHSVTITELPGLTILDPRAGGFRFLGERSETRPVAMPEVAHR